MKTILLTILALSICIGANAQVKQHTYHMQDSTMTCDSCPTSFNDSVKLHKLAMSGTYTSEFTNSFPKCYKVDWSKVKTLKDLKALMQVMNMQYCLDEKQLKPIKKYLIITK